MRVIVAGKAARICGPRIRNGTWPVWCDHSNVKIHEPFPRNVGVAAPHSMGCMTRGTREAVIDVPGVLGKACIAENLRQIVALPAKSVGAVHTEIGARIEIGDQQPGARSLAELVTALKNVRPLRTMRTIRSAAAKLAIVIAIVAVGAENLRSHGAPWS